MPSVRPKPGETVAVHFTSIEPDRTITKNSLPGTGKKKVKKKSIRRKKKQTGGRKNKKKSCGSSFSLPNIFGFLNKTKKSKQKVGGS